MRSWQRIRQARLRVSNHLHLAHTFKSPAPLSPVIASEKKSVRKAKRAIKKLKKVSQIINVAAAAVGLGAAIVSKDPGSIAKNAKLVLDAAKILSARASWPLTLSKDRIYPFIVDCIRRLA